MTTTVGMLLADVHTRAWDLCAELEDRRAENRYGERGLEVLAVWPRLATAALRVLDAVPLEPAWLDDMGSVRLVLGKVGRGVVCPEEFGGVPLEDLVVGHCDCVEGVLVVLPS